MTNSIVDRLRNQLEYWNSGGRFEAANEIERLTAENERLWKAIQSIIDRHRQVGEVEYDDVLGEAAMLLNQQSTGTVFRGCSGPGDSRELA